MLRRLICLTFGLLLFAGTAVLAAAGETRVALVIGNSAYAHVADLKNPTNDAADIAAKLKSLGFDVTLGLDLDYRAMRLMVRDFGAMAEEADIALVYFAGHGIEIDKTNYLIPVNAELRSDRDVEFEALELDSVINAISGGDGLKIVLVDACRNNPFLASMTASSATRSIGRGLGSVDPGAVVVGYAARSGTLALDGDGRNSPYARALLEHLAEPGLEIGKLFRKVRDTVSRITNGYQQPFTYGSLPADDIFLVPAAAPLPTEAPSISEAGLNERQNMFEDFEEAERRNNLSTWNGFLRNYRLWERDPLYRAALERRDLLVETPNSSLPAEPNEPWLEVEYDTDGIAILTRDQRRLVQSALAYMGQYIGTVDGVFGPQTRSAVSATRLKAGLPPGSDVDHALLSVLPAVPEIDALKSDVAQRYEPLDLPPGLEARLERAIHVFEGHKFIFDYFEGHLYLAVLRDDPKAYVRRDWTNGARHTWHSAQKLAQRAGGHLATIGSAAENRFLSDLFGSDKRFFNYYAPADELNGPHFGFYQLPGSPEPSGGWTWVTGEVTSFRAWTPGHPIAKDAFAQFNVNLRGRSKNTPLRNWASNTSSLATGFLVEIE